MSLMHREQMDCCNYFEATGNEITIDSKSNWMQLESIEGNTTQLQTTGAQLFDANKIPSKSQGGATVVNNDDGSFTITGTGVLTETFYSEHIYSKDKTLQVLKPGKYNISKSDVYPRCAFLLLGTGLNKEITSQTAIPIEITAEDLMVNDVHVIISIYGNKNSTIKPGTIKPMVWMKEAIPTDSDWEPYTGGKPSPSPDYPQEIVNADIKSIMIKSAQLFDASIIKGIEKNGIKIINNGDGSFKITGEATAQAYTSPVIIQLEVGQYYVSDGYLNQDISFFVSIRPKGSTVLWTDIKNNIVTIDENTEIRTYISVISGAKVNATIYPMLNIGTTALPWQPYYNPQIVPLTFTKPLNKVGDYADETTSVKRINRCIELTFDGSENWGVCPDELGFQLSNGLPYPMNRREGFCNQYFVETKKEINKPQVWLGINNNLYIYAVYNEFFDDILPDKGLSTWKAHLSTNPLKVITYTNPEDYAETPLDQSNVDAIKSLYVYDGYTIVNNNENTNMKITYKTKS